MQWSAKDKSSGAQMQNIAKKLKFNVDGSAAKISLRLTPTGAGKERAGVCGGAVKASSATQQYG